MKSLVYSWFLIALGVLIAAHTSAKISYDDFATLFVVVIVLSVLNLFLKPLLVLFTLPFVIISLGLGVWLINAFLLIITSKLVNGFEVASLGAAMWGALIISLTSLMVNFFGSGRPKIRVSRGGRRSRRVREEDVIDV